MAGNLKQFPFGSVDEIALYRRIVPAEVFATRYQRVEPERLFPSPNPGPLSSLCIPGTTVRNYPSTRNLQSVVATGVTGFVRLPRKYDDRGVREDWEKG